MWVQIISRVEIDMRGERKEFNSGDWVDVGKQYALFLVREGKAVFPDEGVIDALSFSDTSIFTNSPAAIRSVMGVQVQVFENPLVLKSRYNIWWEGSLGFSKRFCMTGVSLLGAWDMAVPILSYETLALHVGDQEEREKTQDVIRDLRVPLYDTRMIFIRDSEDTRKFIDVWKKEEGEEHLAFLRALYRTKPFILALPVTWTGQNVI